MIKTINIDGKDVKFSFSLASFYIYKNQFGQDAMTVILPLISNVINAIDPKYFEEGKEKQDNSEFFGLVGDIFDEIATAEITEIADIIWAFAKAADDTIPEPSLWYSGFDEFPLVDVGKEFMPCLYDSLISKKKILANTKKTKNRAKKAE